MMSEEAAEATHKRVRQYRLRHTRKDSRIHTMSDLLGYLLVASDPLLSSLGLQRRRRLYANRHGQLQPQTLALLAEPRLHAPTAAADDGNGMLLLAGVVSALIPDNIYQCYKDENYELFNRANRQGMSIDQLIGLIEKLEHSSQAQNMSPQRITASLMRRFRYDGIIDQNVNSEMSSYLEPYTVIQPENSKYQMMTRLVQLANANFPDEAFTLEERCTMHWMLSHSVNETEREDENDYCARSFRRRRRRRRAARRYNSRSSSSGSSAKTAGGFVSGNVVEEDASSCPLELGVIYSPYGTVAAGSLIAGLAAGLSEQDVSVQDTVGADTLTMQSLSDQQRRLQINNIWATTIAGDIAQTALHYEGGGQNNNAPQVIGPTGYWNCTYCPHEYNMPDSDAISALTNAEIYGGIDGYLLGSQIYRWSKQTGFRLSSLLRMYYSPDGVSYDRQFRACDRLTNFLNGDLVNQDTLKTQVSAKDPESLDEPGRPAAGGDGPPFTKYPDDEAFRERLKHMGKASRKKFSQLARLFHFNRRGGARHLLAPGAAPSGDQLLLVEDPLTEEDLNSEPSSSPAPPFVDRHSVQTSSPGGRNRAGGDQMV
ncbi:N-acetylmuramoyl-L-alanine amidase [Amphibalanus amphitrite]|uniref:N-acetylmuramoyl-L-alanine amidase n=1 Tax=Amphibalanus amphitrite TaxID=1232801 RepID=A0A6A4WYT6_AMPAM|nr:N-acetylmuramoyl-L-alanine amidase [Amphibalanus amphitrite]